VLLRTDALAPLRPVRRRVMSASGGCRALAAVRYSRSGGRIASAGHKAQYALQIRTCKRLVAVRVRGAQKPASGSKTLGIPKQDATAKLASIVARRHKPAVG